jgi:hypothetical protein
VSDVMDYASYVQMSSSAKVYIIPHLDRRTRCRDPDKNNSEVTFWILSYSLKSARADGLIEDKLS